MFVSTKQRTLGAVVVALMGTWTAYAHMPAPPVTDVKPTKPGDLRVDPDVLKNQKFPKLVLGTTVDFPPADGKGKAAKQGQIGRNKLSSVGISDLKDASSLTVHWSSSVDNPGNKPVTLAYQITTKPVSPDSGTPTSTAAPTLTSGMMPTTMNGTTEGTFVLDYKVWQKIDWTKATEVKEEGGAYTVNIYLRVTPIVDNKPAGKTSDSALIVCKATWYIQ